MAAPIVIPFGSPPTATARPLIRRKLGRRLGPYVYPQTTATATDGEARRHILLDALIDDEGDQDGYKGRHLYVADGDEAGHQTRVLSTGFRGPLGLVQMARPTATPVASGTTIEVSGSLPAEPYGDWPGLNEIINDAMDMLPIHHDLDFTFVAQQVRYDLSGLNWRFRRSDVIDVYRPIASGYTAAQTDARPISRGAWSVEYDGELPYLLFRGWGCNDGETFFVRLRRPASSWIKSGNVWGNASGFTSDSDETVYDVNAVVNVALPIACERLEAYHRAQDDDARADYWAARTAKHAVGSAVTRIFRGYRGDGRQWVGAVGGQ